MGEQKSLLISRVPSESFSSPGLGFSLVLIEALPSQRDSIDPRQACLGTTPAVLSPLGGEGSYMI